MAAPAAAGKGAAVGVLAAAFWGAPDFQTQRMPPSMTRRAMMMPPARKPLGRRPGSSRSIITPVGIGERFQRRAISLREPDLSRRSPIRFGIGPTKLSTL